MAGVVLRGVVLRGGVLEMVSAARSHWIESII